MRRRICLWVDTVATMVTVVVIYVPSYMPSSFIFFFILAVAVVPFTVFSVFSSFLGQEMHVVRFCCIICNVHCIHNNMHLYMCYRQRFAKESNNTGGCGAIKGFGFWPDHRRMAAVFFVLFASTFQPRA